MLEKAANENVRVHFAIAGALATAIALNAGAAYTYALRTLEAVDAQR